MLSNSTQPNRCGNSYFTLARTLSFFFIILEFTLHQAAYADADFTGSPLFDCNPVTTNFTDSSTAIAPDTIASWSWTFGDGNTSVLQNPSNTYQGPGVYTVALTTTTAAGVVTTRTRTAYVQVIGPDVNFTAAPTAGSSPLTVAFSDTTIVGAPITSWTWSFGDGGASNLQNPSHSYTVAGIYPVSLRVTDVDGCDSTETKTAFVTVTAGAAANLAATSGGGQTTATLAVYTNVLVATVTDASNNLVSGASVTFTAPSSGASATFAATGIRTETVTTDASGQATSSILTANATAGSYNVATSSGSLTAVNFAMTSTSTDSTTVDSTTVIDAVPITVAINGAPSNVASINTFSLSIVFSESVTGFTLNDIGVVNAAASNFSGSGVSYRIDITPNRGGDIRINVAANVAENSAGTTNDAASQVTVTCDADCRQNPNQQKTTNVIKNFTEKRINNIVSQGPDISGFLTGDGLGGGFNRLFDSPVRVNFNDNQIRSQGSFSTSLQQFQRGKRSLMQHAGSATGRRQDGIYHSIQSPVNLWIKGRWTRAKENRGSLNEKNDFGIVYIGADYRYTNDLLVGVMGQVDWSDGKSEGLGAEAKSQGWMLGPYVVKRLTENLILDLRSAWGQSDNKVNPLGSYWDNYHSKRWQVAGNLSGSFDRGLWTISPALGFNYFEETQDAYVDSNNLQISEQTLALGSFNFGPTFSYRIEGENGLLISPLVGVKGIWDFKVPSITDVNGLTIDTEDLRAQAKAGLNFRLPNGTTVQGSYTYDGIGIAEFESHSGELIVNVPLSLRGLKGASFQSSYSATGSDRFDNSHGVKALLSIPFD